MGEKILASTRWKVKMGKKAMMIIAFENRIGLPISVAVMSSVCRKWRISAFRCKSRVTCTMTASTKTTALSTMIPKSMAPKDIRFAEIPPKSTRIKANNSDKGIMRVTKNAAIKRLRNTNKIIIISVAPSSILCSTVCTV